MGKYPYFPKVQSTWDKKQKLNGISIKEITTPDNPDADYEKLYFKSDGELYKLNSSGVESVVGGSSGSEYNEITTATTFTPTVQTGLVKVTVDATDVTGGNIHLKVDGSSIKTIDSGSFENRIINPTSSLSLVSNDIVYGLDIASYDSVSFSVASQETNPTGVTFKPDGTKMWIVGTVNDRVYQYSLSTAWDMSTASYDSVSVSLASEDTQPEDIRFNPTGTKMYTVGNASNAIDQWSISAWNITTASHDYDMIVSAQDFNPSDFSFNDDGTKVYVVGRSTDRVYQYTISTPYDLSTFSYDSVFFSVSSETGSPKSLEFNPTGTKMYVLGTNIIFQYSLSTAWDMTTASYDSISFSVASQETDAGGLRFKPDGSRLFVIGGNIDAVFQYTTGQNYAGTARISIG